MTPRPQSVVWFERLFLASQAIRLVNAAVFAAALAALGGVQPLAVMMGAFANAAVSSGLALVVARGRSGIARWFLVAIVVLDLLGLAGVPALARGVSPVFALFVLAAMSVEVAAMVFAFRKETSDWLKARSRSVNSAIGSASDSDLHTEDVLKATETSVTVTHRNAVIKKARRPD
ncbi:hypothetical protein OLX02_04745 [Novosphingobium sp. KCTC 2891]|uniref:hypothetical protein n=1 Tax=Novosphingobium sp. KCTC 2891 TaxID=2989730 RepID=UPI00222390DA|nr:hypothetical protein [Novosphingobium sp. KCTC 2891]MCW1382121.1 hypothetical protein [Novosphingobium sp. KCTC 2891]